MRSSSLLPSPQALFAFLVFVLPEIVTAQSLLVETTRLVSCSRRSKAGDILHVNYRGTLRSDGTEFDSSYGKQPFVFTLGAGQVIKGWDQGLTEMCIGEARKLTVPPGLAYGSRDMGSIPPNSFLSMSIIAPILGFGQLIFFHSI
jgi:FKBP-type peptidyl-prolyl cis-trans isomerase